MINNYLSKIYIILQHSSFDIMNGELRKLIKQINSRTLHDHPQQDRDPYHIVVDEADWKLAKTILFLLRNKDSESSKQHVVRLFSENFETIGIDYLINLRPNGQDLSPKDVKDIMIEGRTDAAWLLGGELRSKGKIQFRTISKSDKEVNIRAETISISRSKLNYLVKKIQNLFI